MRSLLVANRGEIAGRVFRTAREIGLATVAVFSDADADLPFVRDADQSVRLPGRSATDTYLRGDLIIAAAVRAGADAVHPGYGFLSENAEFASAVIAAGLRWVGPPPEAIAAMGSKLEAKRVMRDAGVPTLPWAVGVDGAAELGYPLLVKAAAGGGGRGMRVVTDPAGLSDAVAAAGREAAGAFGDATVFLERYVEGARHVEVQVLADTHGTVVSLFERECSIQRRHQKIIEESPSPAVEESLRAALGEAAVAAARAVGYVGAGTVEFVLTADWSYFFLEMNTRLQVEHPVTELVTGLDLVRLQLLVAGGEPLPAEAMTPELHGHAIEARLYAEDVANDFMPVTGTLRRFEVPAGVRVDSGVETGSVVSPYYDALLAKVIAHADSRAAAADALASALRGTRVHGVTTNRDLLVGILGDAEFLAGGADTGYLARHDAGGLVAAATRDGSQRIPHAVVAALALQAAQRAAAGVWGFLPSGWRNNPSQPQRVELVERGERCVVEYAFGRDGEVTMTVGGDPVDVVLYYVSPRLVDAEIAGLRRRYEVALDGSAADVDSPLGSSSFSVLSRLPDPADRLSEGSLVAPMPGTVVRVLVDDGAVVAKNQPLVVLEAMKMEHTVSSPAVGSVVEVRVRPGQQVDAGAILAVVEAASSTP